jgi:hypothetical protein
MQREADAQARAGEDRRRLIEDFAEGLGRVGSMRRTSYGFPPDFARPPSGI